MYSKSMFPVIDPRKTGQRIEALRRAGGFSVKDIQSYFGFEYPQAIYKWQHGECLPTVDNLIALCYLFQVKMEDILVVKDQDVLYYC